MLVIVFVSSYLAVNNLVYTFFCIDSSKRYEDVEIYPTYSLKYYCLSSELSKMVAARRTSSLAVPFKISGHQNSAQVSHIFMVNTEHLNPKIWSCTRDSIKNRNIYPKSQAPAIVTVCDML